MFENFHKTEDYPETLVNAFDPANESRSEPRQRCFKTGRIILSDNGPIYDCVFKDLSWFGVRLEMKTFIPLPSSFRLALSYGQHVKAFQCKQIWRNGNEIGVIFDTNP
ncbi:MAG: pilus assembly protein PilZ [Acidimicrobiales bacterium]|nr:pilus assembly protein PilZ [Hyphomonadaceae bacterium]RZV42217.1 MAG: pilus assembly protein PilZ [Acidimicrobiales bacterium]